MFSQSAEFYDAIYSFKDYGAEAAQVAARVRSVHPAAYAVLDVACGTGEHALRLARDHGFEVDGLDLDAGLLDVARRKHPSGQFFQADMSHFALGKRYDVVLWLFSSIGYLVTLERVQRAFQCFHRHLNREGLLMVEPWFAPGEMEHGRVSRQVATHEGATVERTSRTEIEDRVSRIIFDYSIDTQGGLRHVSEIHELGLFKREEMAMAFEAMGFDPEYDPVGLTGRGLWLARAGS